MKYITIYLWGFVSLLTASSAELRAQEFFAAADQLYAQGYYAAASLEYERVVFEQPGNETIICLALLRKTECLKKEEKFEQIGSLLSRLDDFSLSDSIRQEIYFQKALGYFIADKFEQAEKNILPVFNLEPYHNETRVSSALLYTFSLHEQGKWMQAHAFLRRWIQTEQQVKLPEQENILQALDSLYDPDALPRLKSIRKAKTLSLIFPGAGQAYNGNFGKGFVNLLLVSGSAGFCAYNILASNYVTAATAGVYLFLYFYFGGANQSNWLVPEKNYKKKKTYNEGLKQYLSHITPVLLRQSPSTHE